ncbi:matrix metalloproteinase-21-like [Babylonia areolata]|uniref:matrix metalloproteinase-21-like n=1 Tax=Babylonia areolata TaxID=304850 RepID=UPI003FD25956
MMVVMVVPNVQGLHAVLRVVVVVGLCLMTAVVGERFFQRRDHLDQDRYQRPAINNNVVRNQNDAAFMLSKYGYLRCRIQRRRRDATRHGAGPGGHHPQDEAGGALIGDSSNNHHQHHYNPWAGNLLSEEGGARMCNDSEVQQAILRYQSTYNLELTGVLDTETRRLMSALRCGNADTEESAILDVERTTASPTTATNDLPPAGAGNGNGDSGSSCVSCSPPSTSSPQSSSSSRHDNSPFSAVRAGDAHRLWKRTANRIRSDDPSHLLRVLKASTKAQARDPARTRHIRHVQNYMAKLAQQREDAAKLLKPWTEEEHQRAKRSVQVTAVGHQPEQAMNLAAMDVSEQRSGFRMEAEPVGMFNRELLRWRLMTSGYSTRMPVDEQRATLDLAFRLWSEVIPLRFVEATDADILDVDIEIAFGRGSHQNCDHAFDGVGGEIAHSQHFSGMHFDDAENFKSLRSFDSGGISLLRVAVHEIGHVLGLAHTNRTQSIMYAIYHKAQANQWGVDVELNREDRRMMQNIYGVCKGSFSTVFDWVRRRPDNELIYNTYFFRGDHYWMYENHANRTRYGDPLYIAREWEGLPNRVDGYLHLWYFHGGLVVNEAYFFQGDHYYKYNSENDTVYDGWPRRIADDFGPKPGQSVGIPNNLDSVFFDMRDKNIYFFKDDKVYVFDPKEPAETRGCCVRITNLVDEFPAPAGSASHVMSHLLDAVYYSYADRMQYFFKGEDYWRNRVFDPRQRHIVNSAEYMGKWYTKWLDICDVQTH